MLLKKLSMSLFMSLSKFLFINTYIIVNTMCSVTLRSTFKSLCTTLVFLCFVCFFCPLLFTTQCLNWLIILSPTVCKQLPQNLLSCASPVLLDGCKCRSLQCVQYDYYLSNQTNKLTLGKFKQSNCSFKKYHKQITTNDSTMISRAVLIFKQTII